MPELPEVETVRRTLQPVVGAKVSEVWWSKKLLRLNHPVPIKTLQNDLPGKRVEQIRRIGKYLIVDFARTQTSVLVHLGMSGRLCISSDRENLPNHTHVVWQLDGKKSLIFCDPRRFGIVDVVTKDDLRSHIALKDLGPDALDEMLAPDALYEKLRKRSGPIKTALLDQALLAGVGNIYASEALWLAGVAPKVSCQKLSLAKMEQIAQGVSAALHHALSRGGTSLKDFVAADGKSGENQEYLHVYGREGESCQRTNCSGTIKKTVMLGRATYHCPVCQVSR